MTPLEFENILINKIFTNKTVRDTIIPFLDVSIFSDFKNKEIIKESLKFYERGIFPTVQDLRIILSKEELFTRINEILNVDTSEFSSEEFILSEIEEFVKGKLMWNVISSSAQNLKDNNLDKCSDSPDKLREALSFSFDKKIGLDFFESEDKMYEYLHNNDKVVSSGLPVFDRLIKGGFHEKSLTLFMAECIDENTPIKIRLKRKNIS